MNATIIKQDKIKASFFFICINQSRLNDEVLHQAIASAFSIAGVRNNKNEFFKKYIVYAETKEKAKLETDKKKWHFPLDVGEVYRFPQSLVEEKLNLKHRHEEERHRKAGSESIVPPEFLTTETLAITIGSRKFLSLCAWLYLERYGTIREKLLSLMVDIAGLSEHRSDSEGNTCIHRLIDDPNFYPGNFNELRDAARRGRKLSTTELMALLEDEP